MDYTFPPFSNPPKSAIFGEPCNNRPICLMGIMIEKNTKLDFQGKTGRGAVTLGLSEAKRKELEGK